jgi:hypothetical protein
VHGRNGDACERIVCDGDARHVRTMDPHEYRRHVFGELLHLLDLQGIDVLLERPRIRRVDGRKHVGRTLDVLLEGRESRLGLTQRPDQRLHRIHVLVEGNPAELGRLENRYIGTTIPDADHHRLPLGSCRKADQTRRPHVGLGHLIAIHQRLQDCHHIVTNRLDEFELVAQRQ